MGATAGTRNCALPPVVGRAQTLNFSAGSFRGSHGRCNARLIKTKYIIRVLVTCGHGAIERSASCRASARQTRTVQSARLRFKSRQTLCRFSFTSPLSQPPLNFINFREYLRIQTSWQRARPRFAHGLNPLCLFVQQCLQRNT